MVAGEARRLRVNHPRIIRDHVQCQPRADPPKAAERQKELSWSLQEIASSGAYIVSEKTVAAIAAFRNRSGAEFVNDFYGMIDQEYGAAKAALEIIRAEAHRDLGVKG
jgi:hypothetical protein